MSKNVKFGDILSVEHGIIVHGCNAQGVMGSGIALQIKNKWPKCYEEYKQFCDSAEDKRTLLGNIVPISIGNVIVVNAITQLNFGKDGKKYVSYEALSSAFSTIASVAQLNNLPVHYPIIGAGLGGGDWAIISEIIDCAFDPYPQVNRTVWIYE
jgi:O-acetyl-ADP-ribose deacetylase (regulator of RNase III)